MQEFRRSYSKVWWANHFQEKLENEHVEGPGRASALQPCYRQPQSAGSADADNNRNSSSSPSNGSHKSQDSGFSDSDSSSPTANCASRESTKSKKQQPTKEDQNQRVDEEFPFYSKLLETSVNRIPRLPLRKQRPQSKHTDVVEEADEISGGGDLVNGYVTDCYLGSEKFPALDKAALMSTSAISRLSYVNIALTPSMPSTPEYSLNNASRTTEKRFSTPENDAATCQRTCFIVDEIPKITHSDNGDESTTETWSSSSYDDTVRYIEIKEMKSEPNLLPEEITDKKPTQSSSNLPSSVPVKLLPETNESKLSNLDLSRFPEPTFTSTPKKDEQPKSLRKINQKLKRSPEPTAVADNDDVQCRLVDPPVAMWLLELQGRCEAECMTTLQSKRIVMQHDCKKRVSGSAVSMPLELRASNSVQIFQQKTAIVAKEFLNLYEKLNLRDMNAIKSRIAALTCHIKEFIMNYSQLLPRMEFMEKENVLKLMDMCDYFQKPVKSTDRQAILPNDINLLEKFFSQFVNSVLVQQIMLLFSTIEQPNSEATLLNALYGISNLDLNTPAISELVTSSNGVRSLLAISLQSDCSPVRKAALRALAVLCQNATNIKQLEKIGGIEIISEMLCDMTRDEIELMEVVSVLVQITAPWIEDDHITRGLLYHLYPILNALTCLISTSSCCETLLLCAAALANVSFMEPRSVFVLVKLNTASCLLTAVRKLGVRATVFLQEQVATLIANMAAECEARQHLAENRAVGALLCFLQVKHSPFQTDAEIVAAERLQHKSAVALSRLCSNPEISKQIIELQGVHRLVRLCKEEKERNYNDAVLVACLTSLRKITANCGSDSITDLNAKELVEHRLVDSFLLYSSRQESYV